MSKGVSEKHDLIKDLVDSYKNNIYLKKEIGYILSSWINLNLTTDGQESLIKRELELDYYEILNIESSNYYKVVFDL